MSQPVTTPSPFKLASKLEEISGLASQIVRLSNELRMVSHSDISANSASVCALLPVALSNAQNCLSLLEFISQTPISPSTPLPFAPPVRSPTPTPITTETDHLVSPPPPSPIHADTEMKQEGAAVNALLTPAEPHREQCSTVWSRMESPVIDPRFSTPGSHRPAIGTPRGVPAISLDLPFPSRYTPPPTQRWPLSPFYFAKATSDPPIHPTPGGRSDNEHSPPSPHPSHPPPTRQGVSIAELVDEEGSSPGTRGGTKSSHPVATSVDMSWAQHYPPLSIRIVDITPRPTERDLQEVPEVSEVKSLPSSPGSPLMSPARNDCRRAASESGNTPRRSKRDVVPLSASEAPGRRLRSAVKREATAVFGVGTGTSKRVKTGSF